MARFNKAEVRLLARYFGLSEMKHRKRYKTAPEFAMTLVLYRLASPSLLDRLQDVFGMDCTSLSIIFNDTIMWISRRYYNILRVHPALTGERIKEYAKALGDKYCTAGRIWGFIDGTFKAFCRPGEDQRVWYSGYKKAHGLKYQAVVTPDGLIMSIAGPFEGRWSDVTMVNDSAVEEYLDRLLPNNFDSELDEGVFLYGDEAYVSFRHVLAPYSRRSGLTPDQRRRNRELSSLRIAVENVFGIAQNNFAANAFKLGSKCGSMPVAAVVEVAYLLTNCKTCLRGYNQVSTRFEIKPLSIEQYLGVEQPERIEARPELQP